MRFKAESVDITWACYVLYSIANFVLNSKRRKQSGTDIIDYTFKKNNMVEFNLHGSDDETKFIDGLIMAEDTTVKPVFSGNEKIEYLQLFPIGISHIELLKNKELTCENMIANYRKFTPDLIFGL